ncbi:MAG: ABC-type transport auxiliary lipoprotein family protein [Pseudomonadota bacterium]
MKSAFLLCALAALLTGCVNVGSRNDMPSVVYYVLKDAEPATEMVPVRAGAPALLVLDTATGGFYDTDQIVFSRQPGTRGQYQFARWTERPGKRFAELMRARLDRKGLWNVSAAGGYVRGDILLDTELVEFYHDASRSPGHLRLVLRAELVDLKRRALLGRRVFTQEVALTSYDADGAARAANQAVRHALDDLTGWIAATPMPPAN